LYTVWHHKADITTDTQNFVVFQLSFQMKKTSVSRLVERETEMAAMERKIHADKNTDMENAATLSHIITYSHNIYVVIEIKYS